MTRSHRPARSRCLGLVACCGNAVSKMRLISRLEFAHVWGLRLYVRGAPTWKPPVNASTPASRNFFKSLGIGQLIDKSFEVIDGLEVYVLQPRRFLAQPGLRECQHTDRLVNLLAGVLERSNLVLGTVAEVDPHLLNVEKRPG